MQLLDYWPENNILALPEPVSKALLNHLIEPFGDEQSAHEFWNEYPSTIIIIEPKDSNSLLTLVGEGVKYLITSGVEFHEYTQSLGQGYQVNLSIVNDAGNGVYLVFRDDINLTLLGVIDD
ncbi:hypothetical protein NBRC116592_04070 [Colwellia sp. KU-HH00111]|uniref:hypothetical protein n=1 Tax=Colwellia sp. KU-HH00111 TaxID=3127652 RepID=UPI00310AD650